MNKPRKRATEGAGARHLLELRGQLAFADAEFLARRHPDRVTDEDAFALLMCDLVFEWLHAWGARGISVRVVAKRPISAAEAESAAALVFGRGRLFMGEPLGGVVQVRRMAAEYHWA